MNETPVHNLKQLVVALKQSGDGRPIFTVRRLAFEFGGQSLFNAGGKSKPAADGNKKAAALRDVRLTVARSGNQGLGVSLNEAYRSGETDPFIVVTAVRAGSAAEAAGVLEQDVFMAIDGTDIFSIEDVRVAIQGKSTFTMEVQRFGLPPSKTGGINAKNFWEVADDLFDKVDKASGGGSDDTLSLDDLKRCAVAGGGNSGGVFGASVVGSGDVVCVACEDSVSCASLRLGM